MSDSAMSTGSVLEPMTKPARYAMRMLAFLVAVAAAGVVLWPRLSEAFLANAPLNGAIVGVLLLGILYIFRQVLVLDPEAAWIERFRRGRLETSTGQPKLLGPVATLLADQGDAGGRAGRLRLSPLGLRSLLDSISARLDEQRDISRYLIGLLVFLGLLGTFWGLLGTVAGVATAIGNLDVSADADAASAFQRLSASLEGPLDGMATAFSSSLFGLGGSLILGFLELQAAQAQNRFYNELEEWLASLTRLGSAGGVADGEASVPAYIQALLEQTAENMETLERTVAADDQGRAALTDSLAELIARLAAQEALMAELVAGQPKPGDVARHQAALEKGLAALVQDGAKGRKDLVDGFRSELKLLARTIAAKTK